MKEKYHVLVVGMLILVALITLIINYTVITILISFFAVLYCFFRLKQLFASGWEDKQQ